MHAEGTIKPNRTDRFFEFVDRHKVAITAVTSVVATAAFAGKLRIENHKEMIEFIEAKGLMGEFIDSHPIIVK